MYVNSGYLHNSLVDFKDKSRPLVVGSCGTYKLYTRPTLPTAPEAALIFRSFILPLEKLTSSWTERM